MPIVGPLTSDVNSGAGGTVVDITGMGFPVAASRIYHAVWHGYYTTDATTTGVSFGVNVPSGATLAKLATVVTSDTAGTDALWEDYDDTDADVSPPTTSISTSMRIPFRVEAWIITSTTAGEAILCGDADEANDFVVKKGSYCQWRDCGSV